MALHVEFGQRLADQATGALFYALHVRSHDCRSNGGPAQHTGLSHSLSMGPLVAAERQPDKNVCGHVVGAICRNDNVVAGLAAVTDTNLQTATETAANALIGVPISYVDLNPLANDSTLLRRVLIAIAHFTEYILNESPDTATTRPAYA